MITVLHGRAEDLPSELAADCDALICDPPYGARVHANMRSVCSPRNGRESRVRDIGFAALSPSLRGAIARCAGAVRRWSAVFADTEGAAAWREALEPGAEYVRAVPWVRWSQPQLSGDRPPSGCELVLLAHRADLGDGGRPRPRRKRWSGPGNLTHFDAKAFRGGGKHPTEKPLDLMLSIVSYLTDPGETVLDVCAGAGTTGQACRLLDRSAVLVEQSADWAAAAEARVDAPLTDAELERVRRWVAAHRVLLAAPLYPGAEAAAKDRRARLAADVQRAAGWLG